MTPDWTPLDDELGRWQSTGLCLPIWWRDDDAVEPTPALDQVTALAEAHGIPAHLAVIPNRATQALADYVRGSAHLIPIVHGWAHENHAPQDQKKAEFPANRLLSDMCAETAKGLARLTDLFADQLSPVFVPPWNRIAPRLVGELAKIGYSALSTFAPRPDPFAAPGLPCINTHLDPIAWKAGRGVVAPQVLIAQITRQLADRRHGRADNGEPYGILTHHLIHDADIWEFTNALLSRLVCGPTRVWTTAELTQKDKIS